MKRSIFCHRVFNALQQARSFFIGITSPLVLGYSVFFLLSRIVNDVAAISFEYFGSISRAMLHVIAKAKTWNHISVYTG